MPNFAGKTHIPVGTMITIIGGDPDLKGATGKITHPFGFLGAYDSGAIAGAWIDDYANYNLTRSEVNLFPGDFIPGEFQAIR